MGHNARTQPDATWNNGGLEGYVPPPSDWEDLDRKIAQSLNGDLGGTHAPATPIIIGDTAPASTQPGLVIDGPILVAYGGSLTSQNGARFILSEYPAFGPNHKAVPRKIITPCIRRMATQPYHWIERPSSFGIQSIGCTVQETNYGPYANALEQPSFVLPLRVHDGANFARATLKFRVPTARSSSPIVAPRLRIVRVDLDGVATPLKETDDGTGFVSIGGTSVSAGAWFSNGDAQGFVYECDQNTIVDSSLYYYEAQLIEELGATDVYDPTSANGVTTRNRLGNVSVATTPATSIGFPFVLPGTIDGVGLLPGYRILVKDWVTILGTSTSDPAFGVYDVLSIGPTVVQRSVDFASAAQFTPGLLVGVELGTVNAQSMWELRAPFSAARPTIKPDPSVAGPGDAIRFGRRTPAGNVYHSVKCEFTDIPDMRFQ